MTGAQASYLKTLTEQLGQQEEFSQSLTKAEASKRIDALKGKLGRKRGRPRHKDTLDKATFQIFLSYAGSCLRRTGIQ
jgi:Protein of unknown function (DUF3072)